MMTKLIIGVDTSGNFVALAKAPEYTSRQVLYIPVTIILPDGELDPTRDATFGFVIHDNVTYPPQNVIGDADLTGKVPEV